MGENNTGILGKLAYWRGNYEAMEVELRGLEWEKLLESRNVEESWQIIKNVTHRAFWGRGCLTRKSSSPRSVTSRG